MAPVRFLALGAQHRNVAGQLLQFGFARDQLDLAVAGRKARLLVETRQLLQLQRPLLEQPFGLGALFRQVADLRLALGQRRLQPGALALGGRQRLVLRLALGRQFLRVLAGAADLDHLRRHRLTSVVADVPETPEAPEQSRGLEEADLTKRVEAALAALPERQRGALTLFNYEGLSQIEVGDMLGISDEAVESLLARARRSLKVALKDEWRQLLPDTE